jgi:RNA polymerase sigma factor (sigma-70 family)
MTRKVASPILQLIRPALIDPRMRGFADEELLGYFLDRRDESAFEVLMHRHGPMVLDVCRGVLGGGADVEDAFQATFLILAQKAASVRKAPSLGSWLHGVAYRVSLRVRTEAATRRKHEARAPVRQVRDADDLSWREVRAVVHEELGGLPERYRAPLVLCYLESATQEAAAGQLGLARSTLKERLERGRALLRARLVRRGLGPEALVVLSAWPAAAAGMSASLLSSTARAASLFGADRAAAEGLVSAQAAAVTQGVLKMMFLSKLTGAAAVLLGVSILTAGLGMGVYACRAEAGEHPGAAQAQQAEGAPPGVRGNEGEKPVKGPGEDPSGPAEGKGITGLLHRLGGLPDELIKGEKTDEQVVNDLFFSVLARAPTGAERATALKRLQGAGDRAAASRDLLWSLLNSKEFLRLHGLDDNPAASLRLLNDLSAQWEDKPRRGTGGAGTRKRELAFERFEEALYRRAFEEYWKTILANSTVGEMEKSVGAIKNRAVQMHVLDELERAVREMRKKLQEQKGDALEQAAVGDAEFLRRACLDVRGTLPTVLEMHYFLRDKHPAKRRTVLDLLRGAAKPQTSLIELQGALDRLIEEQWRDR